MKMYPSRCPQFNLLANFALANPKFYAVAAPISESFERGESVRISNPDDLIKFFDGSETNWVVEVFGYKAESWSWYFAISPNSDLEYGYMLDYATGDDHPLDDFYNEVCSPE